MAGLSLADYQKLRDQEKENFDRAVVQAEEARIDSRQASVSGVPEAIEITSERVNQAERDVEFSKNSINDYDAKISEIRETSLEGNESVPASQVVNRPNDDSPDKYKNSTSVGDTTSAENPNAKPPPDPYEINFGAEPTTISSANVNFKPLNNNQRISDLRVKLRIPSNYFLKTKFSLDDTPELNYGLKGDSGFDRIRENGGIIFPYTPNILFNYSVAFSKQNPVHSNYALQFYKNSEISNITIQATFTVQNMLDAETYLGSMHILQMLTKMRFGDDELAGLPPPICRLDAHGTYLLKNVPVTVASVSVEYPESVDYYLYEPSGRPDDRTAVPVKSQVTVTVIPMYSRDEMQKISVKSLIQDYENQKRKGYL